MHGSGGKPVCFPGTTVSTQGPVVRHIQRAGKVVDVGRVTIMVAAAAKCCQDLPASLMDFGTPWVFDSQHLVLVVQ